MWAHYPHRYAGNKHVRTLPTYEHFLVLAFAQLTYRESLRDIETCLRALGSKLYHSGIGQPTARSTLADANEQRDWRIFSDFAHVLIPAEDWGWSIPGFRHARMPDRRACCNSHCALTR